ncbi:hypothetical protein Ait01nite_073740 [Actinoplanes italicus]|uniref:Uncharacterized protein n=1 Tax=Actinoplanes italicus TaxID=113567 RepID=A0A2T0K0E4_9ACTN|nr:hypothetical protein CLV67_12069 [Actinoplanes italicus]GIE34329.1 hypothetical protein Ait01nite_073740 [Actinoplanes italicus]
MAAPDPGMRPGSPSSVPAEPHPVRHFPAECVFREFSHHPNTTTATTTARSTRLVRPYPLRLIPLGLALAGHGAMQNGFLGSLRG